MADVEDTRVDRCGPGESVRAGEDQCSRPLLGKRARSGADDAVDRGVARATHGETKPSSCDRAGVAESESSGIRIDPAGSSQGKQTAVGVGATDVAQGPGAAHPVAIQAQGLRSHGDAAVQFQGATTAYGCSCCGRSESGGVRDGKARAATHGRGPDVGIGVGEHQSAAASHRQSPASS